MKIVVVVVCEEKGEIHFLEALFVSMILNVVLGARATLLILKKALANKIPLNEDSEWELPYIIERYKRANVDILSLV